MKRIRKNASTHHGLVKRSASFLWQRQELQQMTQQAQVWVQDIPQTKDKITDLGRQFCNCFHLPFPCICVGGSFPQLGAQEKEDTKIFWATRRDFFWVAVTKQATYSKVFLSWFCSVSTFLLSDLVNKKCGYLGSWLYPSLLTKKAQCLVWILLYITHMTILNCL